MNSWAKRHPGSSSPAPAHLAIDLKQQDKDDPPCKCSHRLSYHGPSWGKCVRPGCGCGEYRPSQ